MDSQSSGWLASLGFARRRRLRRVVRSSFLRPIHVFLTYIVNETKRVVQTKRARELGCRITLQLNEMRCWLLLLALPFEMALAREV